MFLKEVYINEFKILKNVHIQMEPNPEHRVFPVASLNGAGKSTLLQFIFTMLHCSFHEERQKYVQNLLGDLYNDLEIEKDSLYELASLTFEHKNIDIKVDFFLSNLVYQESRLNSFLNYDEIKGLLVDSTKRIHLLEKLESISDEIDQEGFILESSYRLLKNLVSSEYEHRLLDEFYLFRESTDVKSILNKVYKKISAAFENDVEPDFEKLMQGALIAKENANRELQRLNLDYITYLRNCDKVLLINSNAHILQLKEISDNIFLAAPNTQVFQFLDMEKKNTLFEQNKGEATSYYNHISACENELPGLFTYDFGYVSATIEAFKNARDKDFAEALESGSYGSTLQQTIAELNTFFAGIDVSVDKNLSKIKFTLKDTGRVLTPEDLSHGELKKLSIFVWLKRIAMENSLVLMDEIDIGLHPLWQAEIADDLQKWSAENQFLLATHSPHIINSAHYKNLIVLDRTEGRAGAKQYNKAPLDRDLNTIIKTIMGAEYVPAKLRELHDQYRVYVDDDLIDSPEAQELKDKILDYESENSSFFQDIAFDLEMRE